MKATVVLAAVFAAMLAAGTGWAHPDTDPNTNLVKISGVTTTDNGHYGSYVASGAIANADRTADPQVSFTDSWVSSNRSSVNDLQP